MKILLRNTQPLLGDRMMFTPVVRDLKAAHPDWSIGIISAGAETWHGNPHIDGSVTEADADKVYNIGPGKVTRGSKTNGLHVTEAFKTSLEEHLGERIVQGPFKPDIHLSDAEKNHRAVTGPYWVINTDTGPFTAKRWRQDRWQRLVDALPDITFVQVGLAKDNYARLTGANVIDMIERTKIRELFSLVYNAQGCISLVSSLMHVAAAFDKPCVVLAGGREPFTFEKYASHRYIDMTGTLPCCRHAACWHNALSACEDHDGDVAHCMDLITAARVKAEIESYYEGGALERPAARIETRQKPILRIVANTKCLGGAERSVIEIAKTFVERDWQVELAASGSVNTDIRSAMHEQVVVTSHLSRPCDILLLYASDMVFGFDEDRFAVFEWIPAKRRVMALTYKIGKAGDVPWTMGWDKYLFLSTRLCEQFEDKVKSEKEKGKTAVLAPAVDLKPFLAVEPEYDGEPRIVRHSSQGDVKFPRDLPVIMSKCQAQFGFMPGPSGPNYNPGYCSYEPYDPDPKAVAAFLGNGSCFWYLLPDGYTDQGPRVIVEAMAAGLAVIAENRDGAVDRVTSETGWLIDSHSEVIDLIHSLTPEILAKKGKAARQRAQSEFVKSKWLTAIAGE